LVKFSLATGDRFILTPSLAVTPYEYPHKIYSTETRMIVLPKAENRTIVSSFVWTKHRNVKDGQSARGYCSASALRAMPMRCKIDSMPSYDGLQGLPPT